MERILKIDQFVKSFPSKYGLASDGSYYDVLEDFYCEALISYEKKGKIGEVDYLEPVWQKFKAIKEDTIISSLSGAYLQPKDYEELIEIRPTSFSNEGDPSFDRFNKKILYRIGKDITQKKIMDSESKGKLILIRGI